MKTHIVKSAMIVIMAAGFLASPVMACDKGKSGSYGKHHSKPGHHTIPGKSLSYLRVIVKGADQLELNNKQRKAVGDLLIKAQTDAATAHGQAEVTVAAFRSKLYSGKATAKDVKAYSKKMGELRAARLSAHLLASIKAKSLLNDEQREKLTAMHRRDHDKSCKLKDKPHGAHAGHGKK